MSSYTRGCKTTLMHDIRTSIVTFGRHFACFDVMLMSFSAKRFNINILDRNRTKHFLIEKCSYFFIKLLKWCNCWRKCMQEKESIMVVQCELKILSLKITVWHHSASYPRDRTFNLHLTAIKDSYNLSKCQTYLNVCCNFAVFRFLWLPKIQISNPSFVVILFIFVFHFIMFFAFFSQYCAASVICQLLYS